MSKMSKDIDALKNAINTHVMMNYVKKTSYLY